MADRVAAWGYVVMAPNVFYRDGTAEKLAPTEDLTVPANREAFFGSAMKRVGAHTPDQSNADLDAHLDALLALPGVAGNEVGVTGYCMGGRLSLRAASSRPREVVAAGAFHAGGLVTDADDSPHRLIDALGPRCSPEPRTATRCRTPPHTTSRPPERHFRELEALFARTLGG